MANENPLPFVLFIFITSLLCVTSQTNESPPWPIGELGRVAQDAISITICEVNHAKAFIDSIPNLKSLGYVEGVNGNQVLQCVGGLSDAMNNVLNELNKLQQLGVGSPIYGGTRVLESMVNGVVSFSNMCHHALQEDYVDKTIRVMVHRKLEDIVLLTNDVIFRVSRLYKP
ncbi:hypothetical protein Lal_00001928 [Lupinus albus]|uniref:Uncharacterized protein n=1 Tax=Lupinus albus TaxID=3870 RepID=A0A6A5P924_LUPAL|nr:hypothetical protein Lalb_Chr11g0063411 [Lupinus albus]KAF1893451.1 hypothetical protein Lal_00001928 [Lupinus albus]